MGEHKSQFGMSHGGAQFAWSGKEAQHYSRTQSLAVARGVRNWLLSIGTATVASMYWSTQKMPPGIEIAKSATATSFSRRLAIWRGATLPDIRRAPVWSTSMAMPSLICWSGARMVASITPFTPIASNIRKNNCKRLNQLRSLSHVLLG